MVRQTTRIFRTFALWLCAMAAAAGAGSRDLHAGAAEGAVVVCDDVSDPITLDPHYSFDNKADNILKQVYEGLLELDADGRIKPALARSWAWEGDKLVFSLSTGVKFQNGEPFDAPAAAFSLRRLLVSSSPASAQIGGISAIETPAPYTLSLTVKRFKGGVLRGLAAFAKMVPPKYFTERDGAYLSAHPVGTGPFVFQEWRRGREIVFAANRNYRKKGLPEINRLAFRFAPYAEQIELLLKGEIDLLAELPGTQTARVAGDPALKVVKAENFLTPAFWFVNFRGPLEKAEVRQAFNYAVNKDYLIRYGALGNGKVLASFSMPGELGHAAALKPYAYAPGKARELLARAGWQKDFTVRILSAQQSEREARIIAENLKQAGVRSELTVLSIGEMFALVKEGKVKDFDIWANLAPDPVGQAAFLAGVCFYGRSPMSGLRSEEFDALYEDVMETTDMAEQDEKGKKLDALIHARAWGLFTYQRIRTYGQSADLLFKPSRTGMLDFREAAWRKHQ